MPLISFVVPVYNAEKYLHQCLNSITQQLNRSELILVDDGSTDSSGRICDEYAAKYPNVKVLHTENNGASHARNIGVDAAKGMYIVFVDADDYISNDFAEKFEQTNIMADVVFYPIKKLLKDGKCIPMNDGICAGVVRNTKASDVLAHISNGSKFPASPCGKLVLRSFLIKYQIHFAFNRISEDYDWTYQLLRYARCYDFFEEGLYTYRQLPQSRSAMGNSKSVEDQLAILKNWEQLDVEKEFRPYLNSFLAYEYAMILPFYGALSKKDKEVHRCEVRRCSYLLRYGKSRKLKLIRFVSTFLGTELTARILYEYISRRNIRYGKQ